MAGTQEGAEEEEAVGPSCMTWTGLGLMGQEGSGVGNDGAKRGGSGRGCGAGWGGGRAVGRR